MEIERKKLETLEKVLRNIWARETSSDAQNWNSTNPAWGQCAVTALLVNDYFGGEIVWAEAKLPDGRSVSHYFNKINEKEVDLTRCQFPEGTCILQGVEKKKEYASTREYVLRAPGSTTKERYEILKQKIEENLK